MKHIFLATIAFLAAIAILAVSCTDETLSADPDSEETGARVLLRLKTPTDFSDATRSLTFEQENVINEVHVLLFDQNNTLIDIMRGENATGEADQFYTPGDTYSGEGTFSITLPPGMGAQSRKLVALANSEAILTATVGTDSTSSYINDDYATVIAAIHDNITGAMYPSGGTVPMWGETGQINITHNNSKQTIELMRAVARVDVGVGQMTYNRQTHTNSWDGKDAGGATIPFQLTSVTVMQPNNRYAVIPATGNVGAGTATAPTLPAGTTKFSTADSKTRFLFNTTSGHVSQSIYVPEADIIMTGGTGLAGDTNHLNRMAIVIGGYYNGNTSAVNYYRLDFAQNDGTLINVLRNHCYYFNIAGVFGPGFATVDEAFQSFTVNVTANILAWNQADMGNIVFDGQNTLSVSHDTRALYKNAYNGAMSNGENMLEIYTDYTGGWNIEKTVDASDGTTAVSWLNLSPTTGAAGTDVAAAVTAQANTGSTSRSAIIWIAAGRLRYPVTVTQSTTAMPTSLHLSDVNSNVVTELSFTSAAGVAPAAQELHVDWTPPTFSLSVATATETNADAAFPTGSGQPANGETIPAGSGHKVYTIAPPAITTAEYNANPFILKSTKVDVTLNDGVTTTTRTVYLRQMVPNIQVTQSSQYYLVNGSSYSFSVRSNSNWIIRSVTQKQNQSYADRANTAMLNNKTTDNLRAGYVGSPNTSTAGTSVTFTTSSQIGKWGTIDVVIGSPDTPAKFADRTVTLVLAAPALKIYGFGFAAAGEGGTVYNIVDTSQKAGQMIAAARNFGTTATSTVITEPISLSGWNINNTNGTNYTLTTSDIQKAIDFGADVLTLSGNVQWGDDVSVMIKRQFLDNNKPVWINIQHVNTMTSMINTIFGQAWINNIPILYYTNYESAQGATYAVMNNSDPVLVGPFGDMRNRYWGEHWTGSHGLFDLPTNVSTRVSNFINQSGTTSDSGSDNTRQYNCFRLKQVPLFWAADDGFARSDTPNGTNVSPFYVDANNVPAAKTYGGASPQRQIYNSAIVANFIAWCVARNPRQ